MFLVAPPPPHANVCTDHNFVTNTSIKFIFAIAIEVPDYKNLMASIGKTQWPLAAIFYKNAQKACGVSNCVIKSLINFIFGILGPLMFLIYADDIVEGLENVIYIFMLTMPSWLQTKLLLKKRMPS